MLKNWLIIIFQTYTFSIYPLSLLLCFGGLFLSIGKNKDSTNLLAIGIALYCAGALGNRTELFFFGWATDFIGIPRDSLLDSIPKFINPLGPGIANIADFFIVIGRILFFIGIWNIKDYKREAIPLLQTSEIPKDKSLIIKSDKKS